MKKTSSFKMDLAAVLLFLFGLSFAQPSRAQTSPPQAPTITNPGQILAQLPQEYSFTNTTFEFDTGLLASGVGGDTAGDAMTRGSYNWNLNFYSSVEVDLGAANVLDAAIVHPLGLRKAADNWELYAGLGPEYSWVARKAEGEGAIGGRWNVLSTMGLTNSSWQGFSLGGEARTSILFSGANQRPALGLVGFLNYKF